MCVCVCVCVCVCARACKYFISAFMLFFIQKKTHKVSTKGQLTLRGLTK